ncbi:hypothetical protein [Acinetobacter sp. WCHAc060025]|uniref:hypothetical protein n=1 Tax=Acinetobacter sp. WCHAc060025 TaxID=2518625 RepID=UPI001022F3E2|nr:hypothetical protein [Acinetobacter sp. WCHAc060025]RZG72441.1 hypothetical protein EXE09_17125 [Acinetobacter sp. WCHAc060025]
MNLRDQFAIAVLQGLYANGGMKDMENIAELAYKQADAMIVEREKDDVETKDQIKELLVKAINKEHPGMGGTSVNCTASHLIFQLTTGKPF